MITIHLPRMAIGRLRESLPRWLSPTSRFMLTMWVVIILVGYLLNRATSTTRSGPGLAVAAAPVPSAPSASSPGIAPPPRSQTTPALYDKPAAVRSAPKPNTAGPLASQSPAIRQRAEIRPETRVAPDTHGSQEAVRAVQLARLKDQVQAAEAQLGRLKADMNTWQTTIAPLLTSDAGRRIAAQPGRLDLAEAQFAKPRPTAAQLAGWERDLQRLAATVHTMEADPRVAVTTEHATLLKQLADDLSKAAAGLSDQKLLLENLAAQSASAEPAPMTLEQAMQQRQVAAKQAEEQKLLEARKQAQAKAQADLVANVAQQERDKLQAEQQIQRRNEQEKIDALQRTAQQIDDARQRANLDREFQRVRGILDSHLSAFTRPGYSHRQSGSKGPASLSLIRGNGALEPTRRGMERLLYLASVGNDRPLGSLPRFIGSNSGWERTPKEPIELAQQLLRKYGPLMVDKGLLAP